MNGSQWTLGPPQGQTNSGWQADGMSFMMKHALPSRAKHSPKRNLKKETDTEGEGKLILFLKMS